MEGGRASNIDKLGTNLSPIYSGQKGDTENSRKYQLQAQNMQDAVFRPLKGEMSENLVSKPKFYEKIICRLA